MEYSIPDNPLLGMEYPGIVRDPARAIKTLGGSRRLGDLAAKPDGSAPAMLYLRPGDPLAHPVFSEKLATSDLLLQVTVPKLIRVRKRRRPQSDNDSQSPDQEDDSGQSELPPHGAKRLLQTLKDNPDLCDFEFIGRIDNTHRFRFLPDFVAATSTGSFARSFVESVAPMDYKLAKGFDLSKIPSATKPTELLPPPRTSDFHIPFNYKYSQNSRVTQVVTESGEVQTINASLPPKTYTARLVFDAPIVPSEPHPSSPAIDSLEPSMRDLVRALSAALEERPIWTRRGITNHLSRHEWRHMYKYAMQHVSYTFVSGPWREAIIKLGVDPRADPRYRVYQTLYFQLGHKDPSPRPAAAEASHVFDGTGVSLDGRVYQVCDLTEPTLARVLGTASLRQKCDVKLDGWFHNGTMAKAHVLAKAMMRELLGEIKVDRAAVGRVVAMPDVLPRGMGKNMTRRESQAMGELVAAVRGQANAPEGESEVEDGEEDEEEDGGGGGDGGVGSETVGDMGEDEIPIDPQLMEGLDWSRGEGEGEDADMDEEEPGADSEDPGDEDTGSESGEDGEGDSPDG